MLSTLCCSWVHRVIQDYFLDIKKGCYSVEQDEIIERDKILNSLDLLQVIMLKAL